MLRCRDMLRCPDIVLLPDVVPLPVVPLPVIVPLPEAALLPDMPPVVEVDWATAISAVQQRDRAAAADQKITRTMMMFLS
jgi:hypothetical protein